MLTFSSSNTVGGGIATITGTNFANIAVVVWGTSTCPIISSTSTTILCTIPAGQGTSLAVYVTVGSQSSSQAITFDYAAPILLAYSPVATFSTIGGDILTLNGGNFGTAPTISVGGSDCPLLNVNLAQTIINCTMPDGQGTSQSIIVRVGSRTTTSLTLDYTAPVITSIDPTSDYTSGGAILTIFGSNFGTSGSVLLGGSTCNVVAPGFSQSTIRCIIPRGMGTNREIIVVVSSQSASFSGIFRYKPPVITSVFPLSGPTGGITPITISGLSFGQSSGNTFGSVSIGGRTCSISTWVDTQVVCILPIGSGSRLTVSLTTLGTAAQTASNSSLFSYYSPVINTISPTFSSTSGGVILTITGSSFDLYGNV